MNLKDKRVILTGAAGGMGRIIAASLLEKGVRLAMVDANAKALEQLTNELSGDVYMVPADLSSADGCVAAIKLSKQCLGEVDILVNLAGLNSFSSFAEQDPAHIEMMMRVNVLAPMLLTRALLPDLIERNSGQLVNVGSVFGSIGFAWFATYSASKFGLRGFSESLRRELAYTNLNVTYIAPRAVKTPMNDDRVMQMGVATGMNMDEPEIIVGKIIEAIESDKKDCYFGFPESLFVRINALLPRIVDMALAGQNKIAQTFLSK
ncbi:MAG: SDR family oxidoreductase [Mariprofundaceae bacterium]